MKKTIFIKNALVLTVSSLILRLIGVVFKVWLASKIGSEGIGLYQIVFSVYVFMGTFATSGISTAVTRLCADEISKKNKQGIKKVLEKSIFLTLIISVISIIILFFGAAFISDNIISDKRAVFSLKILAFSLPFMGICSCLRGYFIAKRKATPPAISQIIEQIVRISVVFTSVKLTAEKGIAICCAGVFLGDTVSEVVSCIILYIVYKYDDIKNNTQYKSIELNYNIYGKIKEIALPITSGRYINSALRTAENILVPKLLKQYRAGKQSALSQFGMIKGMALPLLFFPSTLLNALSTLLIPELSEAKTKNQQYAVKGIITETVTTTAIISYIFAAIFLVCGREIGIIIYKNETVGMLIKYLSPLVPLMYLDSICDGMLKGLNQQKFTFFISVTDSTLRIILAVFVLPKFGLMGFIAIMYFSNAFTGILNIKRLIFIGNCDFDAYKAIILPSFSAILITLLVDLVVKHLFYSLISVYIILVSTLSVVFYLALIPKITDFSLQKYL